MKSDTDLYQYLTFLDMNSGSWNMVSHRVSLLLGYRIDLYLTPSKERIALLNRLEKARKEKRIHLLSEDKK